MNKLTIFTQEQALQDQIMAVYTSKKIVFPVATQVKVLNLSTLEN
jgi:tRNA(Leu) C34 or U34 (ribose-2'-O)-methylase TrmL